MTFSCKDLCALALLALACSARAPAGPARPAESGDAYDRRVLGDLLACLDPGAAALSPLPAPEGTGASSASRAFCRCYGSLPTSGLVPLELALVIGSEGRVEDAVAGPDSELARCMAGALLETRLPPPPRAPWHLQIRTLRHEHPGS